MAQSGHPGQDGLKMGLVLNSIRCHMCATYLPGNTKVGSITVPLTSCLTGLESAVWQLTIFFICKTG